MTVIWAVASHQGRVRSNNEDSVHPTSSGRSDDPVLLMVADGMGGHIAGEIASALAIKAATTTEAPVLDRVLAANAAIISAVEGQPSLAGMGTTLTLVLIEPDGLCRFAHIGDSRAYLLRDGELGQLTSDHTVLAEYLRTGSISPEEAATHPQRSMLTRALGLTPDINVDNFDLAVVGGDRLLLCSDGVSSMLSDDDIRHQMGRATAEEGAWGLVEEANRAGGHDNITAVLIDFSETGSS